MQADLEMMGKNKQTKKKQTNKVINIGRATGTKCTQKKIQKITNKYGNHL